MGKHGSGKAVKPLIPVSLLAQIAGRCVPTVERLTLQRGKVPAESQLVWDAVDMARLVIVHAHEVAHESNGAIGHDDDGPPYKTRHYRVGAAGVVPVGLGARDEGDDTCEEELDPIG